MVTLGPPTRISPRGQGRSVLRYPPGYTQIVLWHKKRDGKWFKLYKAQQYGSGNSEVIKLQVSVILVLYSQTFDITTYDLVHIAAFGQERDHLIDM